MTAKGPALVAMEARLGALQRGVKGALSTLLGGAADDMALLLEAVDRLLAFREEMHAWCDADEDECWMCEHDAWLREQGVIQ